MKIELCHYSGYKIHPGHGKRFVRIDGKLFHFLSKKCERSFKMKRNPRKITWTVLYRKKHKKGTQEEIHKKRTRRNVKFQRSIQGASIEAILAKRNMKPAQRQAQRDQAISSAKEKSKAKKEKKTVKTQSSKKQTKAPKQAKHSAPRTGGVKR